MTDHTCEDDLPAAIPTDQAILSTFPDSHGLLWFTTSGGNDPNTEPAMVGTVAPSPTVATSCTVKLAKLPNGEIIRKSFGVDPDPSRGGVFVVSDKHLYRFDAMTDGTPGETWSAPYDFGTRIKPGQLYQGSGTTPTLMGTDYVAIGDNADPRMHVVVFKRTAAPLADRQVCAVEVFPPGFSESLNSLIATDMSISVENNYGYDLQHTLFGLTTVPGITRVDLDSGGTGCHTGVGEQDAERAECGIAGFAGEWSGVHLYQAGRSWAYRRVVLHRGGSAHGRAGLQTACGDGRFV